jgi:hypothetical protein
VFQRFKTRARDWVVVGNDLPVWSRLVSYVVRKCARG